MKLQVAIGEFQAQLELVSNGEACRFRLGEQAERIADVTQPEPGVYSVLLNGRSYEARVEAAEGGLAVSINGQRLLVAVRDPRRWSRKTGGAGAEGRQNIVAAMPGKVVRLLVGPGDSVVPGQGLLVVEAMKMQNEMKAPKAGRVVSVAARAGATVTAGEVLATIE